MTATYEVVDDTDVQQNLLLGLAWLGEVATGHIHRLWYPKYAERSVRRILQRLEHDGLIERRLWAIPRKGTTPIRQESMWSLSKAGRALLSHEEQFPVAYKAPRHRLLMHHGWITTETIVHMIELGRAANLSGVHVERDIPLNPPNRGPIMDALVMLRTGTSYPYPNAVPWMNNPHMKIDGELRRRYAIESDSRKETTSAIASKALAYQAAATPAWVEQYRLFPIVVWVVRSEARLQLINSIWTQFWPEGKWLLTVDSWLGQDHWIEYFKGEVRTRKLFEK